MSEVPAEISSCAAELGQRADYLMDRRAYLTLGELEAEKTKLRNLRLQASQHLTGKQLARFNVNMDEVEDLLESLIRRINTERDIGKAFTSEARNLVEQIRAAASLLWTFSPMLISVLHPQ